MGSPMSSSNCFRFVLDTTKTTGLVKFTITVANQESGYVNCLLITQPIEDDIMILSSSGNTIIFEEKGIEEVSHVFESEVFSIATIKTKIISLFLQSTKAYQSIIISTTNMVDNVTGSYSIPLTDVSIEGTMTYTNPISAANYDYTLQNMIDNNIGLATTIKVFEAVPSIIEYLDYGKLYHEVFLDGELTEYYLSSSDAYYVNSISNMWNITPLSSTSCNFVSALTPSVLEYSLVVDKNITHKYSELYLTSYVDGISYPFGNLNIPCGLVANRFSSDIATPSFNGIFGNGWRDMILFRRGSSPTTFQYCNSYYNDNYRSTLTFATYENIYYSLGLPADMTYDGDTYRVMVSKLRIIFFADTLRLPGSVYPSFSLLSNVELVDNLFTMEVYTEEVYTSEDGTERTMRVKTVTPTSPIDLTELSIICKDDRTGITGNWRLLTLEFETSLVIV